MVKRTLLAVVSGCLAGVTGTPSSAAAAELPSTNEPVYRPRPNGTNADGTRCCAGHDCLSTYSREPEDDTSANRGPEPPETAYDHGIPDPIDTATDDGTDGPATSVAADLAQQGFDLDHVQIIDSQTAVIAAAGRPDFKDCPRYYICLWRHVHFRGIALFRKPTQVGYGIDY
jgi:hypothetical protein